METTFPVHDRHAHVRTALSDPLVRAPLGLKRQPGDQARAKRLLREVRAAYALTHHHLAAICTVQPAHQPVVREVVGGARRFILEQNLQEALALAARVKTLPLTRAGVKARLEALDNVAVAQEAAEILDSNPIATTLPELMREVQLLCPAAVQVSVNWTSQAPVTPVLVRWVRALRSIELLAGGVPIGTVRY
ncbi:hypothetical protein [Deinococcus radiotolerans]|uniref:Uncharacterized protein n=1 Tax=Deinococcus radiotolerans TaxID=1309407 RepID=A0ABQ2FQF1_9DEIO|nr:hypothetical protein [Deinococcus radiotolerans]GGL16753.1 hypothetical protein GCM10010844_39580 [Deinococcus radiotolerans]